MDAREAAQSLGKMTVGARIILRPTGASVAPIAGPLAKTEKTAKARVRVLRIHQAREDPLCFFPIVGRQRDVVVRLHAGVNPERLRLKGAQNGHQGKAYETRRGHAPAPHKRIRREYSRRRQGSFSCLSGLPDSRQQGEWPYCGNRECEQVSVCGSSYMYSVLPSFIGTA